MKNDNSEPERLFKEEYPISSKESSRHKSRYKSFMKFFVAGYNFGIARDKKWKSKA